MKYDPIFFEPYFQERIWGGKVLRERFGYEIPSDQTGECWAISAHPNGQSTVKNGTFAGMTLGELWDEHKEVFGNREEKVFPLLVKIIDAKKDLSIQVHPDDVYARSNEDEECGKNECWYVVDCEPNTELILGHHADTPETLKRMMDQGNWDQLLRRVSISPGDFIHVPSGTLHAIPAGALILETQQSSDATYRVYDYDRKDENGRKRDLHLVKALDVIKVPHVDSSIEQKVHTIGGTTITTFIEDECFTVSRWELDGEASLDQDEDFLLVSILEGSGQIHANGQDFPFTKGDHFLLPAGLGKFDVSGNAVGITSHP